MKISVLLSFTLIGAVSARYIFDKRSSCQLGSIGSANAGNAACSASVSLENTQTQRRQFVKWMLLMLMRFVKVLYPTR